MLAHFGTPFNLENFRLIIAEKEKRGKFIYEQEVNNPGTGNEKSDPNRSLRAAPTGFEPVFSP